jgi:ligand-binding sensor protein
MTPKALFLQKNTKFEWEGLEHSLHEHFGVNAVTFEKDGHRMTAGDIPWANDICALIKMNPKASSKICDTLKMYLLHEAAVKRKTVTGECDAGIYRIVVPIIRLGEIEGFVSACGRPFSNAERIYTYYLHETLDEDEEKIKDLLTSLVPIGPRKIMEMKQFITGYVH